MKWIGMLALMAGIAVAVGMCLGARSDPLPRAAPPEQIETAIRPEVPQEMVLQDEISQEETDRGAFEREGREAFRPALEALLPRNGSEPGGCVLMLPVENKGRVLAVDPKTDLVVMSHPLWDDMTHLGAFEVLRGDESIGIYKIVDRLGRMAAGKPDFVYAPGTVRRNDAVRFVR